MEIISKTHLKWFEETKQHSENNTKIPKSFELTCFASHFSCHKFIIKLLPERPQWNSIVFQSAFYGKWLNVNRKTRIMILLENLSSLNGFQKQLQAVVALLLFFPILFPSINSISKAMMNALGLMHLHVISPVCETVQCFSDC